MHITNIKPGCVCSCAQQKGHWHMATVRKRTKGGVLIKWAGARSKTVQVHPYGMDKSCPA